MLAHIPSESGTKYSSALLQPFQHRTWVHLCWTFSATNGESRFYKNGNLIISEVVDTTDIENVLLDPDKVHDSAFTFGQEPDAMRGAYDKKEAYLGDLADFNVWNKVLSDADITKIASCENLIAGNIISWNISNIILYNVEVQTIDDHKQFCSKLHQYIIFPENLYLFKL